MASPPGHCRRVDGAHHRHHRQHNARACTVRTSYTLRSAAEPLLSYEIDRLFRPARRTPNAETAIERAEAGRILLSSSSHSGVAADYRTYLVQLVTGIAGLTGPDAERRVDNVIANAKTAIARSRRSAIIAAFSVAAAILLGAVVACFAASEGGRQRDGAPAPAWYSSGPSSPRQRPVP
jgi:hypothetical protein